jgi:hypothetical protein
MVMRGDPSLFLAHRVEHSSEESDHHQADKEKQETIDIANQPGKEVGKEADERQNQHYYANDHKTQNMFFLHRRFQHASAFEIRQP